jgi:uncharacterized membrane protein YeaQ/YmgE (transglycosylase-associated protein family)
MDILLWVLFGGLVGWIGSLIMNTDGQQGIVLNIIVGIIGAIIGGYTMQFFGFGGVSGFNLYSFLVALIGAVILLGLVKIVRGN